MKRLICLFLVVLLFATGCAHKEKVSFFYPRVEFQYGSEDGVIGSELRDITGNETNFPFLVSLYLMGPMDKKYAAPFPSDVRMHYVSLKDNHLAVSLTDIGDMSESELILSSTCMALTCTQFTELKTVTVTSGDRSVTIHPKQVTLFDPNIPIESTAGGEE